MSRGHPYRFPGKPLATYSASYGPDAVWIAEFYGDYYGKVERVVPIDEWRKTHRFAPQDLVVHTRLYLAVGIERNST